MLFAYSPRVFQEESVKKIADAVEQQKNFIFQAPTGFGKTPVVLAALLETNKRVLWLSKTANQTNRPIFELKKINQKFNKNFLGISFRGKLDMCPFSTSLEIKDYDALSNICKDCSMSSKVFDMEGAIDFTRILEAGENAEVCPYKLQHHLAKSAKLVSMNYNCVFTNELFDFLLSIINPKETVLVVDEAHNLQKIVGELNSTKLTPFILNRVADELKEFPTKNTRKLIQSTRNMSFDLRRNYKEIIINPKEVFFEAGFDKEDLEILRMLSIQIYNKRKLEKKPIRSFIGSFTRFWTKAFDKENKKGVYFIQNKQGLMMYDMRSKEILEPIWSKFASCLFLSGTMRPITSFSDIIGLKNFNISEIPSFSASVYPFLISGVSTKGKELTNSQKQKYALLIKNFLKYHGNSAIFSASYRIQKEFESFVERFGRPTYIEEKGLHGRRAKAMLTNFKKEKNAVLMAPMGGRFAEGADFPGSALEAVMILGVPYEKFSLKVRKMIEYYTDTFGDKGRFHSYVVPAIRRASQAMGRVIRSPQDFGLFVLADERYKENMNLLPDYIERNLRHVHYSNFDMAIRPFL